MAYRYVRYNLGTVLVGYPLPSTLNMDPEPHILNSKLQTLNARRRSLIIAVVQFIRIVINY